MTLHPRPQHQKAVPSVCSTLILSALIIEKSTMSIPNYLLAFNPGQKLILRSAKMTLSPHFIGELVLTSGNLVVCDPLVFPDTSPLLPQFPPGNYQVVLSFGWQDEYKFPTVVCAMLCLSQEKPVTWETVIEPIPELNSVGERQEYSYPVDAGTSCFMDADAAKALDDSYYCLESDTHLGNLLIYELEKKENFRKWANLIVDETTGANVVAFSSGLGDGYYDCYFGYNAEGNIVRVVTDFLFSV